MDLSSSQWVLAIIGALVVGFSKNGIPGSSLFTVAMYAQIFEPRQSTVLMLFVLTAANLIAIIVYRKHVHWPTIVKLMPSTVLGMTMGFFIMQYVSGEVLRTVIGAILLSLAALHFYRQWRGSLQNFEKEVDLLNNRWLAFTIGIFTGLATMIANAAGPITIIYLLTLRLGKYDFIGTMAWFYMIVNICKIPFHSALGNFELISLKLCLILSAFAIAMSLITPMLVKFIPQRAFNYVVWGLVIVAATRLLV